jgi:integrase
VASGSEHYIGKVISSCAQNAENLGERLTEKAVWHVVREYATKAGIDKLAPHDLRRTCGGFATPQEANWSRSSFCSVTFPFRQPNDISVANSAFKVPSTTKSE